MRNTDNILPRRRLLRLWKRKKCASRQTVENDEEEIKTKRPKKEKLSHPKNTKLNNENNFNETKDGRTLSHVREFTNN